MQPRVHQARSVRNNLRSVHGCSRPTSDGERCPWADLLFLLSPHPRFTFFPRSRFPRLFVPSFVRWFRCFVAAGFDDGDDDNERGGERGHEARRRASSAPTAWRMLTSRGVARILASFSAFLWTCADAIGKSLSRPVINVRIMRGSTASGGIRGPDKSPPSRQCNPLLRTLTQPIFDRDILYYLSFYTRARVYNHCTRVLEYSYRSELGFWLISLRAIDERVAERKSRVNA